MRVIRKAAFQLQRVATKINRTALINSYLPLKAQIAIQFRLGEIPSWMDTPYPDFPIMHDQEMRKT